MKVRGRVVHEPIEGGFWGIVDEDGERYQPIVDLPPNVRHVVLAVEAVVEPVGLVSLMMWGKTVRVRSIRPI